jgi:hypothetical protein
VGRRSFTVSRCATTSLGYQIARPKAPNEFRIAVIGDSSTWGILLQPDETLTAYLNAAELTTVTGKRIIAYNLGHPILSLTKDLLMLDMALQHDPDLIIWPVTLRSFPRRNQFDAPIVQNNAENVRRLLIAYDLDYDLNDSKLV